MSEPGGTVVGESDGPAASEVPSRRLAPFVALAVALVLAGLFVVLAGSDGGGGDSVESFLIGRPAPSVVSTTLDDEPFDLSRRKGSWVVINFFDPSCVPCVAEHPELSGQTTEEVRRNAAQLVLAIRRDGQFLFMPDPTEVVQAEDILIVMGPNL